MKTKMKNSVYSTVESRNNGPKSSGKPHNSGFQVSPLTFFSFSSYIGNSRFWQQWITMLSPFKSIIARFYCTSKRRKVTCSRCNESFDSDYIFAFIQIHFRIHSYSLSYSFTFIRIHHACIHSHIHCSIHAVFIHAFGGHSCQH